MPLNRRATNAKAHSSRRPAPPEGAVPVTPKGPDVPLFLLDTQAITEKVGFLIANRSEGAAAYLSVAQKGCTHSTAGHICPDCFRQWISAAFEEGLDAGTALTCKAVDRRLPDSWWASAISWSLPFAGTSDRTPTRQAFGSADGTSGHGEPPAAGHPGQAGDGLLVALLESSL